MEVGQAAQHERRVKQRVVAEIAQLSPAAGAEPESHSSKANVTLVPENMREPETANVLPSVTQPDNQVPAKSPGWEMEESGVVVVAVVLSLPQPASTITLATTLSNNANAVSDIEQVI